MSARFVRSGAIWFSAPLFAILAAISFLTPISVRGQSETNLTEIKPDVRWSCEDRKTGNERFGCSLNFFLFGKVSGVRENVSRLEFFSVDGSDTGRFAAVQYKDSKVELDLLYLGSNVTLIMKGDSTYIPRFEEPQH